LWPELPAGTRYPAARPLPPQLPAPDVVSSRPLPHRRYWMSVTGADTRQSPRYAIDAQRAHLLHLPAARGCVPFRSPCAGSNHRADAPLGPYRRTRNLSARADRNELSCARLRGRARIRAITSAMSLTDTTRVIPACQPAGLPEIIHMDRAPTETGLRQGLGVQRSREDDLSVSSQISVAEDARFELARGCPNTLSNNADRRSPRFAAVRTCSDVLRVAAGERRRNVVNETRFEPRAGWLICPGQLSQAPQCNGVTAAVVAQAAASGGRVRWDGGFHGSRPGRSATSRAALTLSRAESSGWQGRRATRLRWPAGRRCQARSRRGRP
jgi:hypothetical protein